MIKRTITYEDFNGNPQSDEAHFHLSKSELIEMEVEYDGGFIQHVQSIIDANNQKELIGHFKKLILSSYGIKSPDGKVFQKSDELREKFANSAAYSTLFMELATDEGSAAAFINGVIPTDLQQEAVQDKPVGPPPTPSTAAVMPPPVSQ